MNIAWAIVLILAMIIQQMFSHKKHLNLLIHLIIFLKIISLKHYFLATIMLLGGLFVELGVFEVGMVLKEEKRTPNRFKLTLFASTLLATSIISAMALNYEKLLPLSGSYSEANSLLTIIMTFALSLLVFKKARKWK